VPLGDAKRLFGLDNPSNMAWQPLADRGLIEWKDIGARSSGVYLTPAGNKVADSVPPALVDEVRAMIEANREKLAVQKQRKEHDEESESPPSATPDG